MTVSISTYPDICCINTSFIILIVHRAFEVQTQTSFSSKFQAQASIDDPSNPFHTYFKPDEILDDGDGNASLDTDTWAWQQGLPEQKSSPIPKTSTLAQFAAVCHMWANYYTNKPKEGYKLEANTMFRWNVFMATRKSLLRRSRI
jgi:hypothetical protein